MTGVAGIYTYTQQNYVENCNTKLSSNPIFLVGSTDFMGGTYSFTILPSEQDTTVSIPIINDEIVEQLRERFTISLSVEMQPGLSVGNNQTSIIIVDDDGTLHEINPFFCVPREMFASSFCRYCNQFAAIHTDSI